MKTIFIFIFMTLLMEASYIRMLDYEKENKYEKVIQEAKYSFKDYQNPDLHLLWAKSAEKLGKTTEAMSAYERVLILDPNNKEAKDALKNIYKNTQRIGLFNAVDTSKKKNKLRAKANLLLGYDTNINVNASGDNLDGYYGVELGLEQISTSFVRLTADASYIYQFEENKNWFFQGTLDLYHQSNSKAHTYDLTIPTAEIALGYVKDKYLFYFPLSYNNIHYLDQDLLNIFTFTPRVRIAFQKNALWDTSLIYAQRNYIHSIDKTKDATTIGLQTGIYYSLDNTQLHANMKYENRTAEHDSNNRYIDANFLSIDADFKYYITPSLITEIRYLFRYADYNDNIGTFETPSNISRDDYINEIDLKLTYRLSKNTELYIEDIYTKSLSTYIPSEYNKNVFLLGFQIRY